MHSKYRDILRRLADSLAEKENFDYRVYEDNDILMMEILSKDHSLYGMKIKISIKE